MSGSRSRAFKNTAYTHLAQMGKALSSPVRLEILELLAQAPRTVEVISSEVDQTVANTSHHLQVLKSAQLVANERDGLHVVYSLTGDDVAALIVQLQALAAQHLAGLEKLTREFFDDPEGLEAVERDTLLERLRANDAVLLDVRPEQEFTKRHIPGAISLPLSLLESRLGELPRDRTIIAYCRGPFCALSQEAARRLRELGFDARRTDVSVHNFDTFGTHP